MAGDHELDYTQVESIITYVTAPLNAIFALAVLIS